LKPENLGRRPSASTFSKSDHPLATRPSSRHEVIAILAILFACAGFVAVRAAARKLGAHPSREECGALLDRYAEHLVHAAMPAPSPSAVSEARRAAKAKADATAALEACATGLTREEAECAMGAQNADAFERCIE
jgi:hypothetical protein